MLNLEAKKVIYQQQFLETKLLSKEELKKAIDRCIQQINLNIEYFNNQFQTCETFWNKYKILDNIEWTTGFWTGQLCLAYEYNNDSKYLNLINQHIDSFYNRIINKIEVNHHDMGFLYSLSCVAAFKLFNNQKAKTAALLAADNLATRYLSQAKFIQAWGNLKATDNYRLIIDSLLNIPLLHWAAQNGANQKYEQMAIDHFNTSLKTVIRNDGTTFHTYYFDPKTNLPAYGKTRQGFSDSSCWSRGQAWAIYGIPLGLKYISDVSKIDLKIADIFKKVVNIFLNNVGSDDYIAYWDLIFNNDQNHLRDSSASAIAVCGLLESNKYSNYFSELERKLYLHAAHKMMHSLVNKYAAIELKPGHPLLYHGVYSWHSKKGVDEGNQWGDYFYLEGLIRLWKLANNEEWNLYW